MKGKKIISLLLAGSMAVASAVCLLPDQARDVLASDSVVCDGNSADWGSIASRGPQMALSAIGRPVYRAVICIYMQRRIRPGHMARRSAIPR